MWSKANKAAPNAPMKCESSLTFSLALSPFSRAAIIPMLRATPPVNVISSSMPTRRSNPIERAAMDWCTPCKMSSIFFPLPSQERTSDSAKTVQVVLIRTGLSARNAVGPSWSRGMSSALDAAPRNLPVPAAHLSFMQKSTISPLARTRIALVSCPPISITVRVPGMAADFRHLRASESHPVAAVSGTDDIFHFFFVHFCFCERLPEGLLRGSHDVRAGINQRPAGDVLVFVDQDRFGLC